MCFGVFCLYLLDYAIWKSTFGRSKNTSIVYLIGQKISTILVVINTIDLNTKT
jgi:hypothetical protein